jgi:hypothetical protein
METCLDTCQILFATRRAVAIATWNHLKTQSPRESKGMSNTDADGIPNDQDPLPFTTGIVSREIGPFRDGCINWSLVASADSIRN